MPPRSSWKGFLKLSLVSVPVKAYTASSTAGEIHLNQLHKGTLQRIRYNKVTGDSNEPVASEDIVSGYEYAKGQYVVIDPSEIDKLRSESDRSITIDGFVDASEIDPIYLEGRTYYLVPDGPVGQKPYLLLRDVLREQGLVGVAKVVLSGREQLVQVRVIGPLLAFCILAHENKIKAVDAFRDEVEELELGDQELELTRTLVAATKIPDFDYGVYEDEYVNKLTELIRLKVEGQEIVQVQDVSQPQVLNFMEALKQSVADLNQTEKPARKMAASAKAKTTTTRKASDKSSKSATTSKAKKTTKEAAPRKKKSG